jgi:hypothetical protein
MRKARDISSRSANVRVKLDRCRRLCFICNTPSTYAVSRMLHSPVESANALLPVVALRANDLPCRRFAAEQYS